MASTHTANEAWTAVRSEVAKPIAASDTEAKFRILGRANERLWMAAAWSWTIGHLTNIQLMNDTPDYTLAPPADFMKLFHVYIGTTDGLAVPSNITVVDSLPAFALAKGIPEKVAYMGSNTFRFWKTPSTVGTDKWAILKYKKIAPLLNDENDCTSQGFLIIPDEYFGVYEEWVAYYLYRWCANKNAGSAQFDAAQRRWVYTGQLACAQAATEEMRVRENLPLEWEYRPGAKADMK